MGKDKEKQPIISKGMAIALIVTIVVVAAVVTSVLLLHPGKQEVPGNIEGIQKTTVINDSKPFDYDKDRTYYSDECDCCFEDECYDCDCGDCDDCYCDDCECCWGEWDYCYDCDECYDDECDEDCYDCDANKLKYRGDEYSGEEYENVSMSDICEITSSSDLDETGRNYSAYNLTDNSLEDAWVEGANDEGIGQSVYFHLVKNRMISGIKINAGYQRTSEAYYDTSRPRSLLVEFSSGKSTKIELDDVMATQTITFDTPVIAREIKITIESVYDGNQYTNTAISEINLF